jgi:hypothetical protein
MPPQRKKLKTSNTPDNELHTDPTIDPDLVAQSLHTQMDPGLLHPDLAAASALLHTTQSDAVNADIPVIKARPIQPKQRVRKNAAASSRAALSAAVAAQAQQQAQQHSDIQQQQAQQQLQPQPEPEEAAVSLDAAAEFLRTIQEQESQKNLLALAAQQEPVSVDTSGSMPTGLPTELSALQFPLHQTQTNYQGFPTAAEFQAMVDEYLNSLSVKKQTKALLTQQMYDDVLSVLLHPAETKVGSAQFRFWAKKMFKLISTQVAHIVIHENKPVAVKEQLYEVLVQCHGQANHGGRDKTAAQVYLFLLFVLSTGSQILFMGSERTHCKVCQGLSYMS